MNPYIQRETVGIGYTVEASLFNGGEMNRIATSLNGMANALWQIESKLTPDLSGKRRNE